LTPNETGSAPRRFSPRHSLSRKLPLLISALLVAAIVIFSGVAYRQLTQVLVAAAGVRMQSASHLVANLFEDSGKRLRGEAEKVAADSAVRKATIANDARSRVAAQSALARIATTGQQILAIDLRDKAGRELVWADGKSPSTAAFLKARTNLSAPPKATTISQILAKDSVIFYELQSAVVAAPGDTTGFVTVYKQISAANGAKVVASLIGSDASVLIGNSDGKVWTDMSEIVAGPPTPDRIGAPTSYTSAKGDRRIGAEVPIQSLNWLVWVDIPAASVLAPAKRFLRDMAIAALLLVIVGGLAALLISRQITGPLREMTLAAQGMASGDYSRRVTARRNDELGVLAQSFNSMAQQVDESTHKLENRVQERTKDLETALNELHEAQESLVRREKLAMLGQLAGGVGHELRNPLGVMTNAIYYLLMVLKEAPVDVKEYLGIIRTQIALSEKIIGDLLDFARVKQPQLETVAIEKIVREQLERVGDLNGVKLVEDFPAGLPPITVDRVQIGQVVLNLVTNALQSMEGNGKVGTLGLRAKRGANGYVRLEVRDTGIGMTQGQLDKMFEPLFTTKARGIGLGLAVSRSLVQANGGEISAVSEQGKGSTISIDLPAAKGGAT
jgi:signal transduction histidine kinase